MSNLFGLGGLRAVIYLKRISTELKRMNDLMEKRMELDHPKPKPAPKLSSVSAASVDSWNEHWRKQQQTKGRDVEEEPINGIW